MTLTTVSTTVLYCDTYLLVYIFMSHFDVFSMNIIDVWLNRRQTVAADAD